MPGVRRKAFVSIDAGALTLDQIDKLLKKELGAVRVSAYDKTVAQPWAKVTQESENEAMGLFDHLLEKGMDAEKIPLDPFKYEDGDYPVVFVGCELQEPAQEGWSYTLLFMYQHGQESEYAGRPIREQKRIPTEEQYEEDKAKAENDISQTFQRLHQLGVAKEDIPKLNVSEINEMFRGEKYTITLNTPAKNNEKKRQYVTRIVVEDENSPSKNIDI